MFTNLFYELVGEKLKQRTEKEIEEARAEGLDYLEKIHLIRDEREINSLWRGIDKA